MLLFSREGVSERRFPGMAQWFASIWGVAALFGALSWIAYARFDGHVFDLTRTVLIPGLLLSLFAIVSASVLADGLQVSWKGAAAYIQRFLPFVLCIPVLDALFSLVGTGATLAWPLTSPTGVLKTFFTAGLLPSGFLTTGEVIGWIGVLVGMASMLWQWTHSPQKTGVGLLKIQAAITTILAVPSFFAWMGMSTFGWVLGPTNAVFTRAFVTVVHGSYWWRNSSERFLGLSGSEGEASTQGVLAMSLFIGVSLWWLWQWIRTYALSREKLQMWFRASSVGWLYGPFVIGILLGWGHRLDLTWSLPTGIAVFGLLLVLKAMWAAFCLQNDLADLAEDERAQRSTRLTTGALSLHDAEEELLLWRAMALIGGWILGWPIFASIFLFFVCRWLYEGSSFRWKAIWPLNQVILGFSGLVWAWIGWFFLTQSASIQLFGRPVALGVWMVLVLIGSLRGRSPLTPSRIY